MSLEWLVGILIGSGGAGAILSAWFTNKSNSQTHELNLLDRASKEIEKLDKKVKELELDIRVKEEEIISLKTNIEILKIEVARLKSKLKGGA